MLSTATKRVSRFLTIIFSATLLAGCFGTGDGPTPIAGTPAPPPPPPPPAGFCDPIFNFEDACGAVTFTNFEGGDASIFVNPDMSGLNTSDKVARMLKFPVAGGGTFGGTQLGLPSGIDFSAGEAFTMKVWASRQVPVLFKFEGLNEERSLDHSGSGTWEEVCYDFTGTTGGPAATGLTVIFDISVMGATDTDPDNWTFFFDDITQVASCGGGGGTAVALPVTFDDATVDYELTDFGGAATTLVADPDNAANTVASTDKFAGAEVWAGTTVADTSGFGAIPFSATDTTMTLRVYSPDAGIPVLLKVEDRTDNTISVETLATTTVAGTWETLTFDFSNEAAGTAALNLANTYDKASVFFNFGTDGDTAGDKTYLWEDLTFVTGGGGPAGITLPVDFEGGDAAFYELTDFGGAATTLVADPDNAANTVASTDKFAGAEVWAGTTVAETSGFGALPFTATETSMTLRVYSPDAGIPVLLKVEDRTDNTISVETLATTTVAGTWETLTFDFSNEAAGTAALNLANTYDKASVFFNFGTDGDTAGDKTYLWEDLTFVTGGGGGPAGITLPVDFEAGDAAFYELTDFGGAATALVADPADAANTVASSDKFAGSQLWAGTTVAETSGFGALPFSATDTTMTLRVYSPDAGIPVLLKVEDRTDNTISVETLATTTVAGTWETLTFDFSSEAAGTAALNLANTYDKASVFFNFGTDGDTAGDKTYLWDDLTFVTGGGGTGSTSTDFEGGSYTFNDFGGGVAAVVANPDPSGINVSAQVAQMQKFAGDLFGGSTLDLGGPVDLAAADSYTMKVRALRSVVVTFKLETGGEETTATHSGSGTWEELCFDFSGVAATVTGITIIFDNGTAGDAANFPDDWTFQFDDIQQTSGSCPATGPTFAPITFDDAAVTYTLTDFGGNTSVVTNDPAGGTNMVVQADKSDTAELWAGTTISTEANDAVPTIPLDNANTTMTASVYSPDAGIPVRLKVEDAADPTTSVETEATTTAVNTWETLTFDFSNQAAGTAAFDEANTYNKISIFFNFGTTGADAGAKTYYADDIDVGSGGGGGTGITLPVTFEDGDAAFYELTDFGGAATTLVADPANAANTVASTDKFAGSQVWAGTTVADTTGFGALPFSATDTTMTLRVYSPDAGIPVRLKVEDITDGTISVETEATTTVANAWETLTFDFSNPAAGTAALNLANTYDKASVFFNFGTDGTTAGDKTYLWEDLTFVTGGGGGTGITLPVTFEDGDAAFYELTDFGGAATTLLADPANAANTVASTDKFAGSQVWAGTTVADTTGFGALPFSATDTTMTLRVYSPDAGIPVRLKVEDITDGTISVETEATTTVANAWETLTFDFSNPAAGTPALNTANTYDKASVFFNFGTDGTTAGDKTYLWEDLTFVTGGGSGGSGNFVNGDFETGDFTGWTLEMVPPSLGSIALDASGQGGRAGTVARLIASGSDAIGTNDVLLSQVALAAGTVQPGDTIDVSFDLYGSLTGAGGVVFVEVIFLDATGQDVGGRDFVGPAAPYTPTTTWTTHSGAVIAGTATGGGQFDVSGGVTLQLKAACGAIVGGCGVDASIDNVTFTIN